MDHGGMASGEECHRDHAPWAEQQHGAGGAVVVPHMAVAAEAVGVHLDGGHHRAMPADGGAHRADERDAVA